MVYMISMKGTRFVKVGYTNNLEKRIAAYKTHNPLFQFIAAYDGTKKDEKAFHLMLIGKGCTPCEEDERYEWMVMPDGVGKKELRELGFKWFEK